MRKLFLLRAGLLIALLCTVRAQAGVVVNRSVMGTGGTRAASAGHIIICTSGQPAIGVVAGTTNTNQVGFWYQSAADLAGIGERDRGAPMEFMLSGSRPNPFGSKTTIQFVLPKPCHVSMRLYDTAGREIATLIDEELPPGLHAKVVDGTGLSSGVYFCRMQAEKFTQTRKLVLLR
jgi:hypothetical protein